MSDRPWYSLVIIGVLTVAAGAAGWYLAAFTTADPTRFIDMAFVGFGAVIGVGVPPALAALMNRASVSAPTPKPDPPSGSYL
jgi:hypothetical protein